VYVWQMVFVFLVSGLSAGLDVQAWLFNKIRTNSASCWFIVQISDKRVTSNVYLEEQFCMLHCDAYRRNAMSFDNHNRSLLSIFF
jgi:hypothetical protein